MRGDGAPPVGRLGITGYTVLGLLAQGPRSGYEIAGVLRQGIAGNLFARRPSTSYEEPRRLVRQGLAQVERAWQGRRGRSVYTITDAGRQALADWLAEPSHPPVLEVEALLKVLFAQSAATGDPRRAVDDVAVWARERFAFGAEVLAAYQDGTGRFQEQAPLVRLIMLANLELTDALARWARRAAAELEAGSTAGFDDLIADLRERAAAHGNGRRSS